MTTYNRHRRETTEDKIDDMKDKYKDRTIIELSPHHYLAIKDFKSRGYNKIINNAKHRTMLISSRERLLKKLQSKNNLLTS